MEEIEKLLEKYTSNSLRANLLQLKEFLGKEEFNHLIQKTYKTIDKRIFLSQDKDTLKNSLLNTLIDFSLISIKLYDKRNKKENNRICSNPNGI